MDVVALSAYQIEDSGLAVRLTFEDGDGQARAAVVSFDCFRQLAMSAPKVMLKLMQARFQGQDVRLAHKVESWTVERAGDGETCLLTFVTPEGLEISFDVRDTDLTSMSDSLSVYDLEAFPGGLRFQ
jgi:hypothetical protein